MPSPVDRYFKEVKDGNPSYSDEQAWATAWSIYCKHKNPGSDHCHKPTSEYMKSKAAADEDLKKALARLAVAKKAVAAMSESEAKQLSDAASKLYKEAHDLFDEAHRTKTDYYAPIDPGLVEQLRDLHGKVLKGLKFLSRIDSRDASPQLTKDLSTFGLYRLSPDTISEATGLASVIDDKARLVLYKAQRAAQQVRFYTNWVDTYKSTGASPSMEDQWKWLRGASDSNPLREFQDALIVRNVVARFGGAGG